MTRSVALLVGLGLLVAACRSTAPAAQGEVVETPKPRPLAPRSAPAPLVVETGHGEAALRARVELNPRGTDADTLYWQAVGALHLRNRAGEADALLERALSADTGHARALLLRCAISNMLRRYAHFLERCGRVASRVPSSPEAEVALALMADARGQHPDFHARISSASLAAVDGCVAGGQRSCGELATAALGYAISSAAARKDADIYRALTARAGVATEWTVAGPYGGTTVDEFRSKAEFAANGIPVEIPPQSPLGGVFHRAVRRVPDGMLMPANNATRGLHVAQTLFKLVRPAKMTVDARGTGSFRLYIDGRLLVVHDAWADPSVARRTATVAAVPGWHRVVLEMAAEEGDLFNVRFMAPSGSSPVDVVVAQRAGETVLAPGVTPAEPAARALDVFGARYAADPADVEAALAVALLQGALPSRDSAAARWQMLRVAGEFPGSARVQQALATAAEDDPAMPEGARNALVRRASQRAVEHDPTALMARYRLGVLAQQAAPDEALGLLRDIAKERPDYPHAWRSLFDGYRARGWHAEARAALDRALELGVSEAFLDGAAAFLQSMGDSAGAGTLRTRAAVESDDLYGTALARLKVERADDEGALKEWDRLLKTHPDHPAQRERLKILQRLGDLRALKTAAEQHLARFPSDEEAHRILCNALSGLGDPRGHRACLERLQEIFPGSLHPDRVAAELASIELGDDEDPVDAKALMAELAAQEAGGAEYLRGQPNVVVLDRFRRVLKATGAGYFVRHRIVRVGTKDVADQLGEILFSSEEEKRIVRVWRADGSVVEPETGQGKAEVSVSGLAPGDFLEVRALGVQESPPAGKGFVESFYFVDSFPLMRTEYQLDVAQSLVPLVRFSATTGAPERKEQVVGTRTRFTYAAQQVPAWSPEPHASALIEHAPRVIIALRDDEKIDAIQTCRRLATTARPTPELVALAERVKAQAATPSAVLARVLDEVRMRVEPDSEPLEGAEALAEGRGSWATTTRALLRAAGVRARFVVGRTATTSPVEVPLEGTHEQLLLVVPTERGDVVLQADGGWLHEGPVSPSVVRDGVLEADCDEIERLGQRYALPAAQPDDWEHRVRADVTMAPNGDVSGTMGIVIVGSAAPVLRRDIGQATQAQMQEWMASIVVHTFPGAEVRSFSTSSTDARSGPLEMTLRFTAPGLARPTGAGVLTWDRMLERPMLQRILGALSPEEYLRLARRRTPLLLSRPMRERAELRISLPPNASLSTAPRTFEAAGTGFRVKQDVSVRGSEIIVTRLTHVDVARIAPDEYAAWASAVERAVQQGRNRLEVRVGGARR